MTNRSAVLHAPRRLTIEDRPVPEPAPGEVLVRIVAVGICGSDVHYFEHGRIGPYTVETPMVIGHEAAGVIVEVGQGVRSDRIGQRVALEPGVPCRNCPTCLSGRYNLCPDVMFFATPPVDGAICEYVTLASAFAHQVPSGLDHDHAAMAEPVSVGIWGCRRVAVRTGDRVLVTGAGPIGLTITGTFRYANTYPLALDLIASGAVNVAPVITHHFDIDHTTDAMTLASREPNSLKAIVRVSK